VYPGSCPESKLSGSKAIRALAFTYKVVGPNLNMLGNAFAFLAPEMLNNM